MEELNTKSLEKDPPILGSISVDKLVADRFDVFVKANIPVLSGVCKQDIDWTTAHAVLRLKAELLSRMVQSKMETVDYEFTYPIPDGPIDYLLMFLRLQFPRFGMWLTRRFPVKWEYKRDTVQVVQTVNNHYHLIPDSYPRNGYQAQFFCWKEPYDGSHTEWKHLKILRDFCWRNRSSICQSLTDYDEVNAAVEFHEIMDDMERDEARHGG